MWCVQNRNHKSKDYAGVYTFKPFRFEDLVNYADVIQPRPRSGHRAICVGSFFYSFGGFNPVLKKEEYQDDVWQTSAPLFQELWQFNTITSVWRRIECTGPFPKELASHYVVNIGPYAFVYGGSATPFGRASSNKVYSCHLPDGHWKNVNTTGEKPQAMYGQAVYLDHEKYNMYVVGGTTGYEYSIEVAILDLTTWHWEPVKADVQSWVLTAIPPRYRHEIVKHNDNILVFGGGQVDESYKLRNIPMFNLKNRHWTDVSTGLVGNGGVFPMRRKCHVLVQHKNYVYIHGGIGPSHHNDDETVEVFRDFWRFNLDKFQWEKIGNTAKPLYFHSTAKNEEGCMYIFGGVVCQNQNLRTSTISRVWLQVCSLRTMALEALFFYAPHLSNVPRSDLVDLGLPSNIIQEICSPFAACG